MNIYKNDGSVTRIPVSEIDSITHTLIAIPSLAIQNVSSISSTSAVLEYEFLSEHPGVFEEIGLCWSTLPGPTISNNTVTLNNISGNYSHTLEELLSEETIYVRMFAKASSEVFYGNEVSFLTLKPTCDESIFPIQTGSSFIELRNFINGSSSEFIDISVFPGEEIIFALQITKGGNRPQKLRVFKSDCPNFLGDTVVFPLTFSTVEDNGRRFDLRNTDEPQLKLIPFTFTDLENDLYLNFEVDESGGEYSYLRVRISKSLTPTVDLYSNLELGAQASPLPSRMTSVGIPMTICNAADNLDFLTFTYLVYNSSPYLASNPARYQTPFNFSASPVPESCGSSNSISISDGGQNVFFKEISNLDFDNLTPEDFNSFSVDSSDSPYIEVSGPGQAIAFITGEGKKGVIKVKGGTLNQVSGAIIVDVKMLRN